MGRVKEMIELANKRDRDIGTRRLFHIFTSKSQINLNSNVETIKNKNESVPPRNPDCKNSLPNNGSRRIISKNSGLSAKQNPTLIKEYVEYYLNKPDERTVTTVNKESNNLIKQYIDFFLERTPDDRASDKLEKFGERIEKRDIEERVNDTSLRTFADSSTARRSSVTSTTADEQGITPSDRSQTFDADETLIDLTKSFILSNESIESGTELSIHNKLDLDDLSTVPLALSETKSSKNPEPNMLSVIQPNSPPNVTKNRFVPELDNDYLPLIKYKEKNNIQNTLISMNPGNIRLRHESNFTNQHKHQEVIIFPGSFQQKPRITNGISRSTSPSNASINEENTPTKKVEQQEMKVIENTTKPIARKIELSNKNRNSTFTLLEPAVGKKIEKRIPLSSLDINTITVIKEAVTDQEDIFGIIKTNSSKKVQEKENLPSNINFHEQILLERKLLCWKEDFTPEIKVDKLVIRKETVHTPKMHHLVKQHVYRTQNEFIEEPKVYSAISMPLMTRLPSIQINSHVSSSDCPYYYSETLQKWVTKNEIKHNVQ
ncbi:uncharacterized protein NDAI_0C05620 [Naumovozyma dairenensis CBS 421]|uniref:Uncharacterized protein n=1 Tax=Naumovozyma dairenensis (strain ATCC 10597 / BCRC 20456 / CBS 421 / NBRC 0211 / NRRL Y-12639) TaxID=1071378 RepID=G0W8W0_NAUDC|nr:hypothetical protein NDAI_0C05620 [Naumovozyma dairenensis CBS 421]CCD24221.1 hypothetical protein NDAI_0C05620 [Naumovozyma dairenensis CBS 421]